MYSVKQPLSLQTKERIRIMEEHKAEALHYEVDSMKKQLTQNFPISEPTIRQTLLRVLTLIDHLLEEE